MKNTRHFAFWPKGLPPSLTVPRTAVHDNLEVSARRYPDKTAIVYYGNEISFQRLLQEVNHLAGYMQQKLGLSKGDRVILYMQNAPQYVISFFAILKTGAIAVPVNPMNITDELTFYIEDCDAKVAIVGQELYDRIAPLRGVTPLQHLIVAAYSDYAGSGLTGDYPYVVTAPRERLHDTDTAAWTDILALRIEPAAVDTKADDVAVLPYTSGTTGRPKGCIHTHSTVQANIAGAAVWSRITPDAVVLTALPLFHVTGMQHSMNAPIFSGSTMVIITRWNRDLAAELIAKYSITHWTNISTMVVDFLANPELPKYDISSLGAIGGGGAPLPQAVGEKLFQLTGVQYAEGYGLSETISQTHFNPPDRPKLQCMGVPSFDVDSRVVNPDTLEELGPNQEGEVVVNGPQVFKGYWNRPEETEKSFITIDGKPFFRTGDIARFDEEGYYFMIDRVKRMINASGFKVWPTEVESILYKHPAIEQACVIGVPDERRGETVKAYIVLNATYKGSVSEQEIIDWAKEQMAAYKYPRAVQFVDSLPVSGSGKILWRRLQEEELQKLNQA